ncbi:MAG: hypothetical protein K6F80_07630 [Oscillospiraceae bacterium]|nr:hypothetical protein [Oscillospiraceae bacterium]
MSKEIDNMLDDLLREIDAQDGEETAAPKPASQEAVKRAEAIVSGVNQSYRRPPEPVRTGIPAPNIKEVIEPEPTSHFSDERSLDPAIRMHDRLDESSLPGIDAERRPTQIRNMSGTGTASRPAGKRSLPTPPEAPKRKIPHINVPDELPPDVTETPLPAPKPPAKQETDPEREALVKSRAEKIREQLRKRTLEETPIIPPPSEEEIDNMIDGIEYPNGHPKTEEEKSSIFSYLHQVLGVEEGEDAPAEKETDAFDETEEDSRWFDDEPETETEHSLFGEEYSAVTDFDDEEYDDEEDEDDYEEESDYEDETDDEDEEDAPKSSRFRHLEEEDEIEEKKESGLVAFFRGLFRKRTAEADEHELEFGAPDEKDDEDEEYEEYEEYEDESEEDNFEEEDEEPEEESEEEPEPKKSFFFRPAPKTEEPEEEEPEEESGEEPEPRKSFLFKPVTKTEEPEEEPEVESEEDEPKEEPEEPFEDEPEEEFERDQQHHFFKQAFDESAEELAEIKSEPEPKPTQDDDIKTRFLGRNSYFVAGIIVLLLALVGLVTFISAVVKAAGGFFSGGSVKDQLEQALYPVAVVDMPSFNEPAELTAEGALSAAIVDILMHDDLSGYTENFDLICVPAEDVLERGRQMFGVDVQTQLETLHAGGEEFAYDAQSNCFNVPSEPMIFSYAPEVKKIQRNGDTYEVTVIFHGDVASWQSKSRNFTEGTTKTMQATIEKKSTGYRIVRLVAVQ